jgi:hypothetical protein
MLEVLGDLVPYAVPVALSPLPVIAMVMLLLAPAGTRGGLGLFLGRVATLAGFAFVVALLAGYLAGEPRGGDRGGWLRIGLGCLLVLGAIVVWRRRPRDGAPEMPGWMRSLDRASPAAAVRLGALLTVVNLKELALVVGAGTIIGAVELPAGQALVLALVFAALAGLGCGLPLVWAWTAGGSGRARLAALRDWLVRNQPALIAAVLLLLGVMLIGSGLEGL